MFPYEFYKSIHLISIFVMLTAMTAQFFLTPPKWLKIVSGVISALIFISGMGLIARIGIGHGEGWPLWLKLKLTIWIALAAGIPILAKRLGSDKKGLGFSVCLALAFLAVLTAVYKFA